MRQLFLGTSRSKLFPSEVLIVSNISLQCVLKLAENWEKQFQAGVTNQVFCNKVVFLASFQTRKVNIVQWHGLNSNDCKVWSRKWSYLAICTENSLHVAYNNEKQPERREFCGGLSFWKLLISNMKGINPLSFMGKIIQCGWNLSAEVFLADFSKEFVELEESKAVFIVNASADFSRG